MTLQKLMSITRKAVDEYQMITPHDKIAIGISGGKDSIALLHSLHGLKRYYPNPFEIIGITVDLGFDNFDLAAIQNMCHHLDIEYHVVKTDIAQIVFKERQESNPCSLCSKMRKGALNETAKALGCNKVALGHHKEDIVETMLMSLFYEGRFHTFSPVTHWDRMDLYAIRPLMMASEKDIIGYINKHDIKILKSPCPADGYTKREYMKHLLARLNQENPGIVKQMFKAIRTSNIDGWQSISHGLLIK